MVSTLIQDADDVRGIATDALDSPMRLQTVIWNSSGPGSVGYTVTELLDHMPRVVESRLWLLGGDPWRPYVRTALPSFVYRALCRAGVSAAGQGRIASGRVLNEISPGDILYIWPPYDAALIKRARERGAIVVAERINCMGGVGREALLRAYGRRGLPLPEGWFTARDIAEERDQMLMCDFIFAPNELVAESARVAGVPEERILQTSYGFSPERLAGAIGTLRPARDPVFAFVGLGIVRKGIDVLLEAWDRAAIKGKLLIAGRLDEEIGRAYAATLERPDVEPLGYVSDITRVYAAADVFVFPSHEEGGPQVTYEAAACGLPCIVSAMGAGRLVRDEIEGIIIDPCSVDELAAAMARLAEDAAFRNRLAEKAALRAGEFTWAKVAARRYQQLSDAVTRG
jgi:glycosyltransferase involved in cell wall biosynthesis